MTAKRWKHRNPASVREAIDAALQDARERHLSVERVADRLGLASHWALYKWAANGRMPATLIHAFEFVTGTRYLSRFFAHAGGALLVRIPSGRRTEARDIERLQVLLNEVVGSLLRYRDGKCSPEETLAVLLAGLEGLAFQHGQIAQEPQPQLPFGEERDDE